MSLMVAPELVAAAAADLTGIGQAISAANAAAAGPTTQVLAAAGDEVSAAIAALFGTHAQEYQALSARVATFHEQFVRSLTAAGSAYATAEAANASPLQALEQQVLGAINAPTQLWLGRPLIGDGVHGAPGTGQPGGAGGLLWGNGGNGGSGAGRSSRWARRRGRVVRQRRVRRVRRRLGPPPRRPRLVVWRPRPAVAAVAVQDAAWPAGLPGPGGAVGAVADQRASEQRLGGRIDRG